LGVLFILSDLEITSKVHRDQENIEANLKIHKYEILRKYVNEHEFE